MTLTLTDRTDSRREEKRREASWRCPPHCLGWKCGVAREWVALRCGSVMVGWSRLGPPLRGRGRVEVEALCSTFAILDSESGRARCDAPTHRGLQYSNRTRTRTRETFNFLSITPRSVRGDWRRHRLRHRHRHRHRLPVTSTSTCEPEPEREPSRSRRQSTALVQCGLLRL